MLTRFFLFRHNMRNYSTVEVERKSFRKTFFIIEGAIELGLKHFREIFVLRDLHYVFAKVKNKQLRKYFFLLSFNSIRKASLSDNVCTSTKILKVRRVLIGQYPRQNGKSWPSATNLLLATFFHH